VCRLPLLFVLVLLLAPVLALVLLIGYHR